MNPGAVVHPKVRRKAVWGARARLLAALGLAVATSSCGKMARQGEASSYLIVNALEGASGSDPSKFGGTLLSDVVTVVNDSPTFFNDLGRLTLSLGLKDVGTTGSPTTPTTNNAITVNRYHVEFIRADGRNTPGVDVPYPFDGAFTVTVTGTSQVSTAFTIVRNAAKLEAPLAALAVNGVILTTIAEVTVYGRDQTGREVSASARMTIDFANFGDPE
jgi:hypothetical protein